MIDPIWSKYCKWLIASDCIPHRLILPVRHQLVLLVPLIEHRLIGEQIDVDGLFAWHKWQWRAAVTKYYIFINLSKHYYYKPIWTSISCSITRLNWIFDIWLRLCSCRRAAVRWWWNVDWKTSCRYVNDFFVWRMGCSSQVVSGPMGKHRMSENVYKACNQSIIVEQNE